MFGLFGGDDAYDEAAVYMDEIPGVQQQYLGSYDQAGQRLLRPMIGGYGAMATHPGQIQQGLGGSYQQSPGYQWNLDQQLQAGDQAMAAGGMSGSPESQQFAQETASGLADQDYQEYFNNQMRIAGSGMRGLQGMEDQGFRASEDITRNMDNYYYNRANLAGAQAQNQNNMFMGMLGLGGSMMMSPSSSSTRAPVVSL